MGKIPLLWCWGCNSTPPAPAERDFWARGHRAREAKKWGILGKRDGGSEGLVGNSVLWPLELHHHPAPAAEGYPGKGIMSQETGNSLQKGRKGREASREPSLVLHQLNSAAQPRSGEDSRAGRGQRDGGKSSPRLPGGARSLPCSAWAGGGGAADRKSSFDGNENVRF